MIFCWLVCIISALSTCTVDHTHTHTHIQVKYSERVHTHAVKHNTPTSIHTGSRCAFLRYYLQFIAHPDRAAQLNISFHIFKKERKKKKSVMTAVIAPCLPFVLYTILSHDGGQNSPILRPAFISPCIKSSLPPLIHDSYLP